MDNNQNNYYNDPYNTNTSAGPNYYQTPNQTYSTPNQAYNATVEQPKKRNIATLILSIVSLVCGILSVELFWCYGMGIFFAIPGLITRSIALKKNNGVGGNMAKAGFITSLIGLILSIIFILLIVLLIVGGIITADEFNSDFNVDYYY